MYKKFYELKEKPFRILPDPDYLYMSKGHENAYIHLEYAVLENKGFVVVTGEIGSGKTTLINFLLNKIPQNIQVALINNTCIHSDQLLKMVCREFELDTGGLDETEMLDVFHQFLLEQFACRNRVVLFVDEAQNLTPDVLEQLRLFSNLESEKNHLIQIVLVGQPDLKYKLKRKDMEQFVQRITVHCHLEGLSPEEVDAYIRFRLKVAGVEKRELFTAEAIRLISNCSRGIPRVINILCDTALVYGYADGLQTIDESVVQSVVDTREAGGIFSGLSRKGTEILENFDAAAFDSKPVADLSLQETRLAHMETRMNLLERQLADLTESRNKRDDLVLELMKMLQQNMESRAGLMLKLIRAKRELERFEAKDIEEDK